MVSVTKTPGLISVNTSPSVWDNGGHHWVNLQNINPATTEYADANIGNSMAQLVFMPTFDGITAHREDGTWHQTQGNGNCWLNDGGGQWVTETIGTHSEDWLDSDFWGSYNVLLPANVNSPNFGIILWSPGTDSLTFTDFGFNIPANQMIRGLGVEIRWAETCGPGPGDASHIMIDYLKLTVWHMDMPCTPGATQIAYGGCQTCTDGRGWNYSGGPCPGKECVAGETKCYNGTRVSCQYWDEMWGYSTAVVDKTCPGIECTGSSCLDGHLITCENGWKKDQGINNTCPQPGTECTGNQTKCQNGHQYECDNGYYIDKGASEACPGTECTSGQTECSHGRLYNCDNGRWADQGLNTICPGSGCTGTVSHCVNGHRIECENGYEVDKGEDSSCCNPAGSTRCIGGNRQTCGADGLWNGGVADTTCNTNPPPVQNDLSSLLWVIAGVAAVGGGYYLYSRGEKKRSKNVK
jgi:hypothetical protein